ncbi:protein SCO2 homolog, mitochondrial [Brienomyrus brachyistius]|uniref:protein SCO2 homolog, mitochondrial n=1 Tax=Brienomyrus brachyistius TaxID=42636 RepID=UPI0020B3DC60|nr:protein SCO2 homolog, mitochondrial [Brienomyrus brachyistius]XP_048865055.1 protein SCO2 homolog, mitochondrial [Brienomyrus brachyistius]XP_048865056.1 protein SCO2 homolog, mitochondrial [Brienomyrus brachyistius]
MLHIIKNSGRQHLQMVCGRVLETVSNNTVRSGVTSSPWRLLAEKTFFSQLASTCRLGSFKPDLHLKCPGGQQRKGSPACVSSEFPQSVCSQSQRTLSQGSGKPPPRVTLRTRLVVTLLFGGGILAAWWFVRREKLHKIQLQRIEQLRQVALGKGDFSLLDHTGRRRTKSDFLGRWVLLYFGFTHCPDICPEELEKMTSVVHILDRELESPRIQPLFISVDPERDDVAAMEKYVKDFHPRLIGLTGTPEEVQEVGRDFRVYYSKGPKDEDNDYIVDHTVLMYLINPDGLFLDYYTSSKDDRQIAEGIRNHMKAYVKMPQN